MKKIIPVVLLLISNLCYSQLTPVFYIDTICDNPPTTVMVAVKVNNFSNQAAASFQLFFDSVNNNMVYNEQYTSNPALVTGLLVVNDLPDRIQAAWFSLNPISIPDGEDFVTLSFQHNQDTCYLNFSDTLVTGLINSMIIPEQVTVAQQPQNVMTAEGQTAVFDLVMLTQGALIQWQYSVDGGMNWFDMQEIPPFYGVTSTALVIDSVIMQYDQYMFRARFLNCNGGFSDPAVLTVMPNSSLSGTLTYNNTLNSPLANVIITLEQGGVTQYTAVTDNSGNFLFPFVQNGVYDILYQVPYVWGGVNAVDALMILQHSVGLIPLVGLNHQVADINSNGIINSVDALLALKRFVGMISTYAPTPDWQFDVNTVTVNPNSSMNAILHALCTGDVDGSYIP